MALSALGEDVRNTTFAPAAILLAVEGDAHPPRFQANCVSGGGCLWL
jgi:hypothetical protein